MQITLIKVFKQSNQVKAKHYHEPWRISQRNVYKTDRASCVTFRIKYNQTTFDCGRT